MAKIPYLFRRKNIFYFRARIPREHQKLLKAVEVVRSLKTENQAEAIPLALKFAATFKALLQDLQQGNMSVDNYAALMAFLDDAKVIVKRTLRQYGYPPDKQEKATQTVLEQAEVLCKEWVTT